VVLRLRLSVGFAFFSSLRDPALDKPRSTESNERAPPAQLSKIGDKVKL
jgi:hypothetical protein